MTPRNLNLKKIILRIISEIISCFLRVNSYLGLLFYTLRLIFLFLGTYKIIYVHLIATFYISH